MAAVPAVGIEIEARILRHGVHVRCVLRPVDEDLVALTRTPIAAAAQELLTASTIHCIHSAIDWPKNIFFS